MKRRFCNLIWISLFPIAICATTNPHAGNELKSFKMIKKNPTYDRCFGCVIGAALGDSMGSHLENLIKKKKTTYKRRSRTSHENAGRRYSPCGPGQITDDTELALSLSRGLKEMIEKNPQGHYGSLPVAKQYAL